MMLDNKPHALLALVRAGLWEKAVANLNLDFNDKVDWEKVYQLAEEQAVIGVVLAGIERYKDLNLDLNLDQELLLQLIGEVQLVEQTNKAMNKFIEKLVEEMRVAGVYTLLVKGQGIAQCYERPIWRSSGDVDLFLSDANYKKAKEILVARATNIEPEEKYEKHLGMTIDGISVELHGNLRTGVSHRLDRIIDEVQKDVFYGGNVRSWMNGKTQVFLPGIDCDVFFVFTHILKHFFKEGIGLRQICDWCRILWVFRDKINKSLLECRVRDAGIMTEWRSFAALAVDYLGMPQDAMPLYSSSKRWKKNADKIIRIILETGSFGHNRDASYYSKHTQFVSKSISLGRYTKDSIRHFFIFPLDSVKAWYHILCRGLSIAATRR